jgi:hypothetical protein
MVRGSSPGRSRRYICSPKCSDCLRPHPPSCSVDTGVLFRGIDVDNSHVALTLRIYGAIPQFFLYAFMAWTGTTLLAYCLHPWIVRDRIPVGSIFSAHVRTGREAHPSSYTMDTGSFPGLNRPGRCVGHPHLFSAEVKERVELYLYFSGPSWHVLGKALLYILESVHFDWEFEKRMWWINAYVLCTVRVPRGTGACTYLV